jgi:hypothetical protein
MEVGPYATVADAESAVPEVLTAASKNPKYEGNVSAETTLEDIDIPGVSRTFFLEQTSSGSSRGQSNSKYLVGNANEIVFIVACSEYGIGWEMSQVISLAAMQVEKIHVVCGVK